MTARAPQLGDTTDRARHDLHDLGAIREGVMVRSRSWIVAICRLPDGSLAAARARATPLDAGAGSWPLVRGVVQQIRQWRPPVLQHDWAVSAAERCVAATPEQRDRPAPADLTWEDLPRRPPSSPLRTLAGVLLSATIFTGASHGLATLLVALLRLELGASSIAFHVLTGFCRAGVIVGYMRALRRFDVLHRMFQYATAAFQVLVAHDTSLPLTLASVRRQSPLHPRTSANYVAIALALYPAVTYACSRPFAGFAQSPAASHATGMAVEILALLLVFGLTFEIQELAVTLFRAGKLRNAWPWLCSLQRAATVVPDDDQLQVAIRAVDEVLALEAATVPTA